MSLVIDSRNISPDKHKGSEDPFLAAEALERTRRVVLVEGEGKTDMPHLMAYLPVIAKFYAVDRSDVIDIWCQDYGLALALG